MESDKQILTYLSSNQVDAVSASVWLPQGDIKGIVQICHGMCEYIDRYEQFARFLTANGLLVCGNDHIGHGRTAGSEDKFGYFAPANGGQCLVDDVHKLRELVQKQHPSLPYFLLGHSMGSFITRSYIAQRQGGGLNGYICCGTMGPNPLAAVGLKIANHLIKKHGDHFRSPRLQSLAFYNYNRKYGGGAAQFAWVSRDEAVQDAYEKDPWCNFVFTAGAYRDLFTLLRSVSRKDWAGRINKYLPILIASGTMDPVGGYGKGAEKVYTRLSDSGVHDLKIKLYPNARHELLNETNRKEVYTDFLHWINQRM